jgi:monoamine oxidase
MNEVRRTDVAVVGGGISGLVTARELRRRGLDVLVLEAQDRVGGRTLNHPLDDGKVVELGGQWAGPGQDEILALAAELGIDTFPTYDSGDRLLDFGGKLKSYRGSLPRRGPIESADVGLAILRLERMARTVPPEAPWDAPDAVRWDAQTFASWIRDHTCTRFARELLTLWAESVLAVDPGDLSLLHVLAHAHSHHGVVAVCSTGGGAQEVRFVGGSQQVSLSLAAELGDRILHDQPVRAIAQDGDGVRVHTDSLVVHASRVVVAMSPAMSARIAYTPALPAVRDQLSQRVPLGSIVKCIGVYDEPFWRADGLSGQALSDRGPVKFVFDNSPPDGSPGILLGFVAGADARAFSRLSPAERRTAALACFGRWFGPRATEPADYVEKIWAADAWARGGYAGYMPPRVWTTIGPALTEPVGRIHWAGSETSAICMGSMDGAVRAGKRAAAEVAAEVDTVPAARVAQPIQAG